MKLFLQLKSRKEEIINKETSETKKRPKKAKYISEIPEKEEEEVEDEEIINKPIIKKIKDKNGKTIEIRKIITQDKDKKTGKKLPKKVIYITKDGD